MKSERSKLRTADYRYHRRDGYLSVEDVYQSPLVQAFEDGSRELGLSTWDYNTPVYSFAASTVQATVRRGRRNSAATAFLWPVKDRPNLDIVTSAFVTEVLIDQNTREAYGVQYDKNGKKYKVTAKREVILSAGIGRIKSNEVTSFVVVGSFVVNSFRRFKKDSSKKK